MSSAHAFTPVEWGRLAELEEGLLLHIQAAEGELRRAECLDEEQRAEIQAILEALKHDGESHVSIIQALSGGPCDA